MKQIGNFQTDDPVRLSEQLDRLQANVVAETTNIRKTFMPELQPVSFVGTTGNPAIRSFTVGQIAICDTSFSSFSVSLVPPSDGAPGFAALVKKLASAVSITLLPSGVSAPGIARTINNAASKAYAGAAGLYWLFYDGTNWWAN